MFGEKRGRGNMGVVKNIRWIECTLQNWNPSFGCKDMAILGKFQKNRYYSAALDFHVYSFECLGRKRGRGTSRGSKICTPDRMHFTELRSDPWFRRYGLFIINILCLCVCVCIFFLYEREFNSASNGTNNFAIGQKLIEMRLFL